MPQEPVGYTNLHLGIGPARHFDDHVEHGLALVGVQRDVVERRQRLAVLFDEDAVLERVGSSDLAGSELVRGIAVVALLGDGKGGHGEVGCS